MIDSGIPYGFVNQVRVSEFLLNLSSLLLIMVEPLHYCLSVLTGKRNQVYLRKCYILIIKLLSN